VVDLTVNGVSVKLNSFVSDVIQSQILALVGALRDIPEPIEEIRVTVTPGERAPS